MHKIGNKKGMNNLIPFFLVSFAVLCAFGVIASAFYLALFCRKNRPNYNFKPGQYCMEKSPNCPPRKEFYYLAGNSTLRGYYYHGSSKKLVVLVHGFRSGADDFLPLAQQLVANGFCVFAFDCTGSYDSKGNSLIGMCQPLVDLDNTLKFIKTTPLKSYDLYLVGHSLGGYAVLSALKLHPDIKGCVALAPVCDATKIMVQKATQYIGPIATIYQPFFQLLQRVTFGDYASFGSIEGINSTTAPVLVVQGTTDKVVPPNTISVTARQSEVTNPNAKFWHLEGILGGHCDLWHSRDAIVYKNFVTDCANAIKQNMPFAKQKLQSYYSGVDNALYSQVSPQLMEKILQTFAQAV